MPGSPRSAAGMASPRGLGVKSHVQQLERQVEEQHLVIERLSRQLLEQRKEMQMLVKELSERTAGRMVEMEDAMEKKHRTLLEEVQQLHKGISARKGETALLAQQSKETTRLLEELGESVEELRMDLHGE